MARAERLAAALLAAAALPSLVGCAAPAARGPELLDVEGRRLRPLVVRNAVAHALVFTTVDCPIANGYAPAIEALADEFEPRGVRFFLVHVDPEVDAARAAEHAAEYGYHICALLDPRQELAAELGVTVTPEAAVVLPGGVVSYRGRIDDLYADLGVKRAAPTRHDLSEALEAAISGRTLPRVRTVAVGCYLPELDRP